MVLSSSFEELDDDGGANTSNIFSTRNSARAVVASMDATNSSMGVGGSNGRFVCTDMTSIGLLG